MPPNPTSLPATAVSPVRLCSSAATYATDSAYETTHVPVSSCHHDFGFGSCCGLLLLPRLQLRLRLRLRLRSRPARARRFLALLRLRLRLLLRLDRRLSLRGLLRCLRVSRLRDRDLDLDLDHERERLVMRLLVRCLRLGGLRDDEGDDDDDDDDAELDRLLLRDRLAQFGERERERDLDLALLVTGVRERLRRERLYTGLRLRECGATHSGVGMSRKKRIICS
ncbi:uncharacterized protein ACA1_061270 [Acanthamoeba castellanii str. Neff]|uniref:Uncharacterized protein n=1 Tax=Acanthamoeba castellanii (strain ATCC 30010 / Neff) TaxID=1257118 RepID=L8GVY2_ACACF|nr:uncharacterized protein ACA1_061270 [Acanthamoeba castellanii str. Neff]ELR17389.1 hypothetical protein ACA1_061270 [Acanthamoeba castellanii str. Neff]